MKKGFFLCFIFYCFIYI